MLRVLFGCQLFCSFANGEPCTLCALALLGLSSPAPDIYGHLFNLNFRLMAIINSLAIGKSVKSAGNLTYKTVRGRTIASQRITQNKSNTPFQQNQRQHFAKVSESMKLLQQYIDVCYEKSKYGSSRNAFFSTNKNFTLGNLVGEITEGIISLSDGMLSALTETPVKQLSLLSLGSLAGFLTIKYKDVANYKYGENTYGSLRVIANEDASAYSPGLYDFRFSSPVKRTDLRLYFFGFSDSGLIVSTGKLATGGVGDFTFNNGVPMAVTSNSRAYPLDEDENLIESVHVEINLSTYNGCPIAIVVPSVSGKVPTISGVFAKAPAV